jgi:FkbM family methyltransferase
MKIYSQNNEQEIIIAHFMGKTDGTFLDLGANDGITLSNTRALFERGWKGVLVDASPKAFPRLKENYRGKDGITLYQLALTSKSGKINLHDSGNLIGTDDVGLVSTIHAHEVDRFKSIVRYEDVEVPCFTWDEFINASPIKHFDFVSMDIEGCELDVLPHMDLSKTQLICIETNSNEELEAKFLSITSKHGLKTVIYRSAENVIICR